MINFFCLSPGGRLALLAWPLAGLLASAAQAQSIATFAPPVAYNAGLGGANGGDMVVADLNSDGLPDVVTANTTTNMVGVLLGKSPASGGGFELLQQYPTGASTAPRAVTVADVNKDGLPDLITANNGTSSAGVLLARSAASGGGFEPAQQYRTEPQLASWPVRVAVGDVNGDGLPDLVAANNRTNSVGVILGKSAASGGGFQPVQIYSTGSGSLPYDIELADMNGDGLLDIMTANNNTNGVGVMLGKSAASGGGFQPPQYYSTGGAGGLSTYPRDLEVTYLNGDGLPDIVTANRNNKMVGVLLGRGANGGGGFEPAKEYSTLSLYPETVAVADVNGDGLRDLISNNIGIFLGRSVANGDGFGTVQLLSTGVSIIKTADVNGDGKPDLLGSLLYANGDLLVLLNTTGLPTLNSLSAPGGPVGTSLTLTGTYLGTATAVSLNGQAVPFTAVNATTITATVPAGATTGNVVVTTPTGTSNGLPFSLTLPDLVVSTTTTIPAGLYTNITITGTGTATLAGDVAVVVGATVQDGGALYDNCYVVSGPGTFTLDPGATLGICNPAGLVRGAAGAVQVAGLRRFSPFADYVYNGTTAQSTGNNLPGLVRSLTTLNPVGLTLTEPLSVSQTLTIGGAGDLLLTGNALKLLSDASGTTLVVNSSTGVVSGTATVQRYIDPSRNPVTTLNPQGQGYRHYAAPVSNTTVADFYAFGSTFIFQPVVNSSYNTSANPSFVTPFPTVFGYDQALVSRTTALPNFDKGFFSPAALTDALVPGRGYAVNVGGTALVDFVGTLGNGDLTVLLARNAAGTPAAADAGWALLGNPYPAPLDYSRVAAADRAGLEAAIYVYSSTSQYRGQYRSYVNGIGNPVLPLGQGFFARVASGQTSGALTFRNSQRLTAPNNTAFQRTAAADPRPLVQLDLNGAGLSDTFVAYAEARTI
jgi:hypothetical protein